MKRSIGKKKRTRKKQLTSAISNDADQRSVEGPQHPELHSEPKKQKSLTSYRLAISLTLLVLVVAPATLYFSFARVFPANESGLGSLDILTDCKVETHGFVTIRPRFGQGWSAITVGLADAKQVLAQCTTLKFVLPGPAGHYSYLLPTRLPSVTQFDARKDLKATRRPITDVQHDPFGYDVVTVHLKDYEDFTGYIEYAWYGGPEKLSYADYDVSLPFGGIRRVGEQLVSAKDFRVSMPVSKDYALLSHSPGPSAHKTLGDLSFYWFDIGHQESTLSLSFEERDDAATQRLWQPILLTIIGGGVFLLVAEFVSLQRAKKELTAKT